MFQRKPGTKLSGGSKREELYEALLNGLTEEAAADQKPVLWFVSSVSRGVVPSQEEIRSLTEEEIEGEYLRYVCPSECRNWALENWGRVIPYAKEIFLEWAKENSDDQFLEGVRKFER
jgi:hypothetical protein